jgi:Flp pilus assembly protein CpaB
VLVAAKELHFGDIVDESGLRWDDRLKDNIPEGVIRKSLRRAALRN